VQSYFFSYGFILTVDLPDLDRFRAPITKAAWPSIPARKRSANGTLARRPGDWFIKGPIPGSWLGEAAALPGRALHVALAVWFAKSVAKGGPVKLTGTVREKFRISPHACRLGLGALKRAGLVAVEQRPGRCPVVTILGA
jgi:hypothetical protein